MSYYSIVRVSDDGGSTWHKTSDNPEYGSRTYFSLIALSDGSVIIVGGRNPTTFEDYRDVWRTTDFGTTWTCMTSSAEWTSHVYGGGVDVSGTIFIFNSLERGNDVWKSTDLGATWACVVSGGGADWPAVSNGAIRGVGCDRVGANGSEVVVYVGGTGEPEGRNGETWAFNGTGGASSGTVITSSVSGDVYNIGGISGESTKNIIFTMWKNRGYGGR